MRSWKRVNDDWRSLFTPPKQPRIADFTFGTNIYTTGIEDIPLVGSVIHGEVTVPNLVLSLALLVVQIRSLPYSPRGGGRPELEGTLISIAYEGLSYVATVKRASVRKHNAYRVLLKQIGTSHLYMAEFVRYRRSEISTEIEDDQFVWIAHVCQS